jgi:8-oxo-dGTP diphosphatase
MAYLQAQITTQAVIQNDEGKILLLRRNKPGGWFTLPGGTVEEGESVAGALKREIAEETGLEVEIGKPLWVWQSDHIGRELLGIVFLIDSCITSVQSIVISKEHNCYLWVSGRDLFNRDDVDPYIKKDELRLLVTENKH